MKTATISLGILLAIAGNGFSKPAIVPSSDERIIAAVLIAEAGGEGETGMAAIAEVIRNRSVEQSKSAVHIVTARNQFSCLNNTKPASLVSRTQHHAKFGFALNLASTIVHHPSHIGNATRGANYYIEYNHKAFWMLGETPVAVIGHHRFYKL